MSICFTTFDANGNPVHNYVGDATIQLQSANGTAAYQAPTCNDPPPAANPLVTEPLPAYTIHTSVNGGSSAPVAAREFDWLGAQGLLVAAVVLLMLKGRRIKPSRG
jgi:hypothetical protein